MVNPMLGKDNYPYQLNGRVGARQLISLTRLKKCRGCPRTQVSL
jgi:hypothetical protein